MEQPNVRFGEKPTSARSQAVRTRVIWRLILDALDNPSPGIHLKPFHHITAVDFVRSDRCNWSFYPG